MSSSQKGDRRERELVNELDDAGFAVMRAPASGSATDRELPDVLAGDGDSFYAIEAKSSAGDPIYLDGEEVAALVYFSRSFGAKARVGVRFDHEDWYFFHPDDLHRTDGGNYRVKLETALAEGTDFAELTGQSEKVTLDEVGGSTDGDGSSGGEGSSDGGGAGNDGGGSDGADGSSADGGGGAGDGSRDADGTAGGDESDIEQILTAVEQGTLSVDEAAAMLE